MQEISNINIFLDRKTFKNSEMGYIICSAYYYGVKPLLIGLPQNQSERNLTMQRFRKSIKCRVHSKSFTVNK